MAYLYGGVPNQNKGMSGVQNMAINDDDDENKPWWKDMLGGLGGSFLGMGNMGMGGGLLSGALGGLISHFAKK